jgi:YHS domain-containing protein
MKTISITCHKCGKSVDKLKNEYDRQIRNGRQYFFCSLSCTQSYNKKTTVSVLTKCLWCKKEFETTTHKKSKMCCSIDCAKKYSRSKLDKDIHKQSVQRPVHYPQNKKFICEICKNTFDKLIKFKKQSFRICSEKCYIILASKLARENPNCGGELGYKHYTYKNIIMDSIWEVEIAKWMDEKGIKWDRSRKRHMFWWTDDDGNKRRYYPDFYLPELNVYLDPKNKYKMENDRIKMDRVIKENGIILYWGILENIKKEIDTFRKV